MVGPHRKQHLGHEVTKVTGSQSQGAAWAKVGPIPNARHDDATRRHRVEVLGSGETLDQGRVIFLERWPTSHFPNPPSSANAAGLKGPSPAPPTTRR